MKDGRWMGGCLAPVAAGVAAALLAMGMISLELVMFDIRKQNNIIAAVLSPILVQEILYFIWYKKAKNKKSRDAGKLAKSSLCLLVISILISLLLIIGIAVWYSLVEEGFIFLIAAAVLYSLAALTQYIKCRPY